jgi:glyoxylase-like metal-dependent hydrolase (beta-lactamase superfamily II)
LVESDHDLTLIDTFYLGELPKLERDLNNIGCEMKDIKRIILTHLHSDHSQTANEAAYLAHNPLYPGPPDKIYEKLSQRHGLRTEDVINKFERLDIEPLGVDHILNGDTFKSLKVIHTPGHTPGHMSLYYEEERTLIGVDILCNTEESGPPSYFTLDTVKFFDH